jgi:predicted Zn-dependent protease
MTERRLSAEARVGNETYTVVSESVGLNKVRIVTRVYYHGETISAKRHDYDTVSASDTVAIGRLLKKHNDQVLQELSTRKPEQKAPADYVRSVRSLLARRSNRKALLVLEEALESYPGDPFLLSYFGCLTAVVDKDHERGIRMCTTAMSALEKQVPFGQEFFYPTLYLNLGRAYLAAGRKKEAVDAFKRGLRSDPENRDLLSEMNKLGRRKPPVLPFLARGNPINKYIGLLVHR